MVVTRVDSQGRVGGRRKTRRTVMPEMRVLRHDQFDRAFMLYGQAKDRASAAAGDD